jgi:hypothetical protein
VSRRAALDALIVQRGELERQHAAAVALLEKEGPGAAALLNRRRCGSLYDELAGVQRRIDALLAAERAR